MRRLWSESAAAYGRLATELATYRESNRAVVAAADLAPGCTVLDLACGGGATLEAAFAAQPAISRAWAVDWVEAMVDEARRRLAGRPVTYLAAPAQDFARHLGAVRVDRVLSNGAFFQFDRPAEVLRQIERVLTPAGLLAFTLPGPSNTVEFLALFHRIGLTRPLAGGPAAQASPPPAAAAGEVAGGPGAPPLRCTPETVDRILGEAGWALASRARITVRSSQEEYVRWMSLPVFRRPEWRGWPQKELEARLRQALRSTDLQPVIEWLVIAARPT